MGSVIPGQVVLGCVRKQAEGWRDGSVVKRTDCSSKGPEFKSQKPPIMRSDALLLVHLKAATVYLVIIINKSIKREKNKR